MRQNLLRADSALLSYPIREVVEIGKQLETLGEFNMIWENIGDPVAAGETVPGWMHDVVQSQVATDQSFAYTETRGASAARQYVLDHFSDKKKCTLDDILFFNGLGEAINKVMNNLPKETRVLVPSPTYPSHATAESMHAGCSFISYSLDPENDWEPDVTEIENKVKYNDNVVAILVINPNNPTGSVYKRETLEKIVAIAKKYDCFLIFDEIYHHMTFDGVKTTMLHEIIDDVPGISMKGISKDIPWPGSRCGWIEVYNAENDANFKGFIEIVLLTKMLEVCSTTLPQIVLPHLYDHPNYPAYLQGRIEKYQRRADEACVFFADFPEVRVNKPKGVFYLVVELLACPKNTLESINKEVRLFLDKIENDNTPEDFQFAYELMGSQGICVVPLTGFGSTVRGFRMTLLQEDDALFSETLKRIGEAIKAYYPVEIGT